ncbi:MAG: hypothetical protein E7576_16160 [Ruminococcaceae bacterium]|nr:hypothetical protein [Oscillospiraceae bacterium]
MTKPHFRIAALIVTLALLSPSVLSCRKGIPIVPQTSGNPDPAPSSSEPAGQDDSAETHADAPDPSEAGEKTPSDEPAAEIELPLYLPAASSDNVKFPEDGKVYAAYSVNYGPAGKIAGGNLKNVADRMSTVEAVPNLGYKFVCWSDGSRDPVRRDTPDNVPENKSFTALFDYDVLDMPVIAIDTSTGREVQSKTEYISADFRICGTDEEYSFSETIQLRGRGNNSWGYEKKSYKMKFPQKVNLFGLGTGKDKVWVLLANVCDQSLQRNHVALELARRLEGIDFSPASKSVEVYLNGEYRGVYLLAEEIRDSKARVVIDSEGYETETDIGYVVELSSYASGDTFSVGGKSYQVHSDLSADRNVKREQIRFITDYLGKCLDALKAGDRAEIEALIDVDSMLDTYLAEEVVKNLDTGWDSFYLYKAKGGKLFIGPIWDFDLSLGNANEGEETIDGLFAATRSGSGGGNPWCYRPMELEWFRELAVARWDEIKPKYVDVIPGEVREEGAGKLRSYERNFIRWKIFGTTQNRETEAIRRLKTYKAHYEYLADWAEQRIAWLDKTYHAEGFLTAKLSSGGSEDNGGFADDKTKKLFESLTDIMAEKGVTNVRTEIDGFGGEGVENLFDGEPGTKYCWPCYGESEFSFELKSADTPTHYAFMTANDTKSHNSRNPERWTIYGSVDGRTWEVMDEEKNGRRVMNKQNYTWNVFEFDKTGEYRYYKIHIVNDDIVQFGEFALMK